jgi:hypothetical protein
MRSATGTAAVWFLIGVAGALSLTSLAIVTLPLAIVLAVVVLRKGVPDLVRDDGNSAARKDTSPSGPVVPRCRAAQLALSIEMRHGSPTVVLRHVSGPSCDVGTLDIATRVRDQRAEPVLVQDFRGAFTGEISPAVDLISGFVYTPLCNQRGPLVATVTAGDLTASLTFPVRHCLKPDTN